MSQQVDRSRYKPTLLSNLEAPITSQESDRPTRTYLSLNPGLNKFRMYPAHVDGGGQRFAELAEFWYVDHEQDEYVNNVKTGHKIIKKKKVFDAVTHSSYIKKDPIREYMKYAEKTIKENIVDEQEKTQKLGLISHFKTGLKLQRAYMVYAQRIVNGKLDEFGLLELKPGLMNRLNTIASIEGVDDVLGVEPYTDVNEGFPIIINYDKGNSEPAKTYSLELDKSFDRTTRQLINYPLGDDDLARFESRESLYSLYRNVYTRRDFEIALEGIQRYDEKNNIGVFQYEEFLNILQEISSQVDELEKSRESETPKQQKPTYVEKTPTQQASPTQQATARSVNEYAQPKTTLDAVLETPMYQSTASTQSNTQYETAIQEPQVAASVEDKMAALRAKLRKS